MLTSVLVIKLILSLATLLVPTRVGGVRTRNVASLHVRQKTNHTTELQLPVFLISLPESPLSEARRRWLEPQLSRHADSVTHVQAINGRKGDLQQYIMTLPQSCDTTTQVQLAATTSHLKAILEAYRSGVDLVLIMEDDMKVLRWPSHGLLHTAPPDWEILLLYMMGARADSIYRSPPSLWVPYEPSIFSAGAYIIRRRAMQRILDTYMPGTYQSDGMARMDLTAVSRNWEYPLGCQSERVVFSAAKTYVCTDFTIVERSGESTLDKSHRAQHDATTVLVQELIEQHGFTLYH